MGAGGVGEAADGALVPEKPGPCLCKVPFLTGHSPGPCVVQGAGRVWDVCWQGQPGCRSCGRGSGHGGL